MGDGGTLDMEAKRMCAVGFVCRDTSPGTGVNYLTVGTRNEILIDARRDIFCQTNVTRCSLCMLYNIYCVRYIRSTQHQHQLSSIDKTPNRQRAHIEDRLAKLNDI